MIEPSFTGCWLWLWIYGTIYYYCVVLISLFSTFRIKKLLPPFGYCCWPVCLIYEVVVAWPSDCGWKSFLPCYCADYWYCTILDGIITALPFLPSPADFLSPFVGDDFYLFGSRKKEQEPICISYLSSPFTGDDNCIMVDFGLLTPAPVF